MTDWVCMKCGYKWREESKKEPRQLQMCRACVIHVPRVIKPK